MTQHNNNHLNNNNTSVNVCGKYDLVNKHGVRLCHFIGCRRHVRLIPQSNGFWCRQHSKIIKKMKQVEAIRKPFCIDNAHQIGSFRCCHPLCSNTNVYPISIPTSNNNVDEKGINNNNNNHNETEIYKCIEHLSTTNHILGNETSRSYDDTYIEARDWPEFTWSQLVGATGSIKIYYAGTNIPIPLPKSSSRNIDIIRTRDVSESDMVMISCPLDMDHDKNDQEAIKEYNAIKQWSRQHQLFDNDFDMEQFITRGFGDSPFSYKILCRPTKNVYHFNPIDSFISEDYNTNNITATDINTADRSVNKNVSLDECMQNGESPLKSSDEDYILV